MKWHADLPRFFFLERYEPCRDHAAAWSSEPYSPCLGKCRPPISMLFTNSLTVLVHPIHLRHHW